jgi:peroxiredoxin Q/BCP
MNKLLTVALAALLVCLVAGLAGTSSADEGKKVDLKVGDPAPAFHAKNDQDKTWNSADHVGKKIVVVYFYPAALTPGCTRQACAFRDDMEKLHAQGVEVVGVSGDPVKNLEMFKKVHNLNFTLLSDPHGTIAEKFGVPFTKGEGTYKTKDAEGNEITLTRSGTAKRWTFVIGKDGKIIDKETAVNPAQDSKHILKVVHEQGK